MKSFVALSLPACVLVFFTCISRQHGTANLPPSFDMLLTFLFAATLTCNRQKRQRRQRPQHQRRWAAVYEDEMEVLTGDSAARAAGVGRGGLFSSGVGGGGQPKTGNQGPPPKDKPGPGSFNGETFTGDSWDTSGASF